MKIWSLAYRRLKYLTIPAHGCGTPYYLTHPWRRSVGQETPVSPAEQTWARLLAAHRTPSPLRSLIQACALVVLLLGFLVQQGALMTWPLSDLMLRAAFPLWESLVLDDSCLDDDPSSSMMLTVGDFCLQPAMVMGTVAFIHTCLPLTRYLIRPQLLTRLLPLR